MTDKETLFKILYSIDEEIFDYKKPNDIELELDKGQLCLRFHFDANDKLKYISYTYYN